MFQLLQISSRVSSWHRLYRYPLEAVPHACNQQSACLNATSTISGSLKIQHPRVLWFDIL